VIAACCTPLTANAAAHQDTNSQACIACDLQAAAQAALQAKAALEQDIDTLRATQAQAAVRCVGCLQPAVSITACQVQQRCHQSLTRWHQVRYLKQ
jgi:hypothetical protein